MNAWAAAGGPVLIILLVLGAAAVVLFATRLMVLRRSQVDYADFMRGVANVLSQNNPDEALAICDETAVPVARVVATAIRHRTGSSRALREAVDATGRAEVGRLERRLAALAVIAQVAPLIGLFGTVLGMIRTVLALDSAGPILRADLVGGLLQALVATAAGLLVAIPSHVMYAMLRSRVDRLIVDIEAAAGEILATLAEQAAHARAAREAAP